MGQATCGRGIVPRAVVLGLLLALVGDGLAPRRFAHAEPDARSSAADQSFKQGVVLLKRKDYAAARALFAASAAIDPKVGTLVNLSECEENLGELVQAYNHLDEAIKRATKEGDRRLPKILERQHNLDARIPRLRIRVASPAEGQRITVSGTELSEAVLANPIRVNPGTYKIEARAPGRRPHDVLVEATTFGRMYDAHIPPLELLGSPSPSHAPAASTSPLPSARPTDLGLSRPPASTGSSSGLHTGLSLTLAGLGLVSLGIGTYFGLSAKASLDDAGCTRNACPTPEAAQRYQDSQRQGNLSTAMFVAGGALAAGGILYFALTRGGETKVEAGMGSIRVVGRF